MTIQFETMRRARVTLVGTVVALACAWGPAGCGSGNGSSDPRPTAARFVDLSYGAAGQVALPDNPSSIALMPDGSVYFGTTGHGIYKVDATGREVSAIEAAPAYALVEDKSGNAYAAYHNGVFRFTAAGRDTGYATSGMALAYTPAAGINTGIWTLVPLPDGSLYVILWQLQAAITSDIALVIVKLGAEGLPVASFGDAGRVTHHLGSITSFVSGAVDSAGNLYLAYSNLPFEDARMNVAKFDRDGRLVTNFGNGGIWSGSKTRCDPWGPIAIDSSGFVWLPGACTDGAHFFDEVLVKLDSNGVPVAGFGKDGYLEGIYGPLPDRSGESIATRVVIAPDGTIYVSGYAAQASPTGACAHYRVVALDPQGNRITNFGTDGTLLGARLATLDAANRLYVVSRDPSTCPSQTPRDVLSRYLQ